MNNKKIFENHKFTKIKINLPPVPMEKSLVSVLIVQKCVSMWLFHVYKVLWSHFPPLCLNVSPHSSKKSCSLCPFFFFSRSAVWEAKTYFSWWFWIILLNMITSNAIHFNRNSLILFLFIVRILFLFPH